MKKYVVVFCIAFLTGCAASGRIGDMPEIADINSASEVVVIRVSNIVGAANSYIVSLNGNDFFNIGSGENTKFLINEGEHFISVKCFGGWTPTWKEESLKFNAGKNKVNYFEISPNMSCAEIVEIDQPKANELLKTSAYVDLTVKALEKPTQKSDETTDN